MWLPLVIINLDRYYTKTTFLNQVLGKKKHLKSLFDLILYSQGSNPRCTGPKWVRKRSKKATGLENWKFVTIRNIFVALSRHDGKFSRCSHVCPQNTMHPVPYLYMVGKCVIFLFYRLWRHKFNFPCTEGPKSSFTTKNIKWSVGRCRNRNLVDIAIFSLLPIIRVF